MAERRRVRGMRFTFREKCQRSVCNLTAILSKRSHGPIIPDFAGDVNGAVDAMLRYTSAFNQRPSDAKNTSNVLVWGATDMSGADRVQVFVPMVLAGSQVHPISKYLDAAQEAVLTYMPSRLIVLHDKSQRSEVAALFPPRSGVTVEYFDCATLLVDNTQHPDFLLHRQLTASEESRVMSDLGMNSFQQARERLPMIKRDDPACKMLGLKRIVCVRTPSVGAGHTYEVRVIDEPDRDAGDVA